MHPRAVGAGNPPQFTPEPNSLDAPVNSFGDPHVSVGPQQLQLSRAPAPGQRGPGQSRPPQLLARAQDGLLRSAKLSREIFGALDLQEGLFLCGPEPEIKPTRAPILFPNQSVKPFSAFVGARPA